MSSFQRNQGPMISGGCGSVFQLSMTKPTGSSPAYTARNHGLACGYSSASATDSATVETKTSCPGVVRSARTDAALSAVIGRRGDAHGGHARAPRAVLVSLER